MYYDTSGDTQLSLKSSHTHVYRNTSSGDRPAGSNMHVCANTLLVIHSNMRSASATMLRMRHMYGSTDMLRIGELRGPSETGSGGTTPEHKGSKMVGNKDLRRSLGLVLRLDNIVKTVKKMKLYQVECCLLFAIGCACISNKI